MTAQHKSLPATRLLTISYQYYLSQHKDSEKRYRPRQVPFLRLSGDWLQAAGFSVGKKARVQVTERGLMIVIDK